MKVVVIGSTGIIGRAIVDRLSESGHEVVRVGHSSGDLRVDITDTVSEEMREAAVKLARDNGRR